MNNNIVLISELSTFNNPFTKKKKDTLGGHVKKGAKIGAELGAVGGAVNTLSNLAVLKQTGNKLPKKYQVGALLGGAAYGAAKTAIKGGLVGAGVYGGKKVLKKTK